MPHPGLSQISLTPVPPEPVVSLKKPQILMLSVAVAAALSACAKKEEAAPVADAAKPAEAAYKLDESKLPGVNRFTVADLDTTKDACSDFGGYVNGKWLAAHPSPGDRTSWRAFETLNERPIAVQRQLADQAAADTKPAGVEKIVGDFSST